MDERAGEGERAFNKGSLIRVHVADDSSNSRRDAPKAVLVRRAGIVVKVTPKNRRFQDEAPYPGNLDHGCLAVSGYVDSIAEARRAPLECRRAYGRFRSSRDNAWDDDRLAERARKIGGLKHRVQVP